MDEILHHPEIEDKGAKVRKIMCMVRGCFENNPEVIKENLITAISLKLKLDEYDVEDIIEEYKFRAEGGYFEPRLGILRRVE